MIFLMFHDVVDQSCPISGFQTLGAIQYRLDKDTFENFVSYIAESQTDVALSFDDGGVSSIKIIAPTLEKYSKKGLFCITTSCVGRTGFLSEDQIRALDANGHIIASHSHTHPKDISKLSERDLFEEWYKSKEILENILNKPIVAASIPGGAVSKKVIQSLFKAGYSEIYTSEPSIVKQKYKEGFVVGRFAIKNSTTNTELQQLLGNLSYRRRLLFKYRILRIVKLLMGKNYNFFKQEFLKAFRK